MKLATLLLAPLAVSAVPHGKRKYQLENIKFKAYVLQNEDS
jgi:hypothetical protein